MRLWPTSPKAPVDGCWHSLALVRKLRQRCSLPPETIPIGYAARPLWPRFAALVRCRHPLGKPIAIASIEAATVVQITHYGQYPSFVCAANRGLEPTWRDAPPKVSRQKKSNAVLNAISFASCIH